MVTHHTYWDTPYGEWNRVVANAVLIGIPRFRDACYWDKTNAGWQARHDAAIDLAGFNGIKWLAGFGTTSTTNRANHLDKFIEKRIFMIGAEGENEVDLRPVPQSQWIAETKASQLQIWNAVHPYGIKVVGPSFGSWYGSGARAAIGDLTDRLDYGNLHPYTGGTSENPTHIQTEKDENEVVVGSAPFVASEHGFTAQASSSQKVSEAAQATYSLRSYAEHFKAGLVYSFIYEMLDLGNQYGLLRSDFSWKPAAQQIHNLIQLLGADGSPATREINITISDSSVRSLVLQRTDGDHVVLLWRLSSVYNLATDEDITISPSYVTVTLPDAESVQVGVPANDGVWQPSNFNGTTVTPCLAGDMIALRVVGA